MGHGLLATGLCECHVSARLAVALALALASPRPLIPTLASPFACLWPLSHMHAHTSGRQPRNVGDPCPRAKQFNGK